MTDEQKQVLLVRLTALEAQFQEYTQKVRTLLASSEAPVSPQTMNEIRKDIQQKGDEIALALTQIEGGIPIVRTNNIKKRGFGSMSPEKRRRIASSGGKTAQKLGKAHKYTQQETIAAGKIGGRIGGRARKGKTYKQLTK